MGPSATHTNPIPLPFQNPLIYGNDMVSLWEGGPLIEGPWSILNAAPYHRHHWKMQERTWHTERHAVPPSSYAGGFPKKTDHEREACATVEWEIRTSEIRQIMDHH